jgi:hypothetical protein
VSGVGAPFAFALALATALVVFEFAGRRIYSYAVTPTHFEVRLFGRLRIYRIALSDIGDVTFWRISPADIAASFTTLRLGNRVFGTAVVIKRRGGFPRCVIVTPDDPARMLSELRGQIFALPRGSP